MIFTIRAGGGDAVECVLRRLAISLDKFKVSDFEDL